jgi:hypothetical protein
MTNLLVNPHLEVRMEESPRGQVIVLTAPVRNDRLRIKRLLFDEDPGLLRSMLEVVERQVVDLDDVFLEPMRALGVIITQEELSRPVFFECPLDRDPPEGAPEAARSEDAILAPVTFQILPADAVPAEVALARAPNLFTPSDRVWIRNAGTEVWHPYTVTDPQLLAELAAGRVPLALRPTMSNEARDRLKDGRGGTMAAVGQSKYANLPGLWPPRQLLAMQEYFQRLVREGWFALGDFQSDRYFSHNQPLASLFHLQLAPLLSGLLGKPVKPSYCYLGAYRPGASLAAHLDRGQCTYSLSCLIDYAPSDFEISPWPLLLGPADAEPVAIHQRRGDSLLYLGCELTHARPALPPGHRSLSVFFHYVDGNYEGRLD